MMNKVIVFGCGQLAEVADFYLSCDSDCIIEAFVVDKEYKNADEFCGKPLLAFDTLRAKFSPSEYKLFMPIGFKKMNSIRQNKYFEAKAFGYQFYTYISSEAICYASDVGENTFVLENNVIQPFVRIGNNCILWSGNHVGHHSVIADHCFISSHVVISGSASIGRNSFLGVNSTIADNVMIGNRSLIGAGAVVTSDTEVGSVYSACKSIRHKFKSDKLRF